MADGGIYKGPDATQENEGIDGACERARRRTLVDYREIPSQEIPFVLPNEAHRYRNPEDAFVRAVRWMLVLCIAAIVAALFAAFGVAKGWW